MTELLPEQPAPHVYLVAGGGGGQRSTIVLRMIAEQLRGQDITYTAIDGISGSGDSQMVRYPSLQLQDIEASVQQQPEGTPLLFISHCIGTVAALGAVDKYAQTRNTSLVSIAPPLPSPRNTLAQPQSQSKRIDQNSRMRVIDIPETAKDYSVIAESFARIDPQYFVDIQAADDLEPRLRAVVESGNAAVYAPEHDWNVDSPRTISKWHEHWHATLPEDTARQLQSRTPVVQDAAHGLYISGRRTGLELTPEERDMFQSNNVQQVISTGLDLLQYQSQADASRVSEAS